MSTTFHDPREFLRHLESALSADRELSSKDREILLHGCMHTIRYLIDSQALLTHKVVESVDILNSNHPSWGHKLSELYHVLEAAEISPEEMNKILVREVHKI